MDCLTYIVSMHELTFKCVYTLLAATFIPLKIKKLEWECLDVKFCAQYERLRRIKIQNRLHYAAE